MFFKKKKVWTCITLIIALMLMTLMVGCGNNATSTTESSQAPSESPKDPEVEKTLIFSVIMHRQLYICLTD